MLVNHVSPPVILARKRLASHLGVRAAGLQTVELAQLVVLVVDVSLQVRLGAELLVAALVGTLVWPLVVASVVTRFPLAMGGSRYKTKR